MAAPARSVLPFAAAAAAAVTFLAAAPGARAQQALGYPDLLQRVASPDWLYAPPAAGERCVQFSSYDRSSDKGPGDHGAWYGNDDRGKYLRTVERSGKKEYVMVEADGPGCIARIWSANPSGELFFGVDGERVWTVDFAALTSGKVEGVGEPLAGVRARGANCHLPIPFAKKLVVSASKGDFYYQVNVVHFAAGTVVPSFRPELLREHADAIGLCNDRLRMPMTGGESMGTVFAAGEQVAVPAGAVVRQVLFRPKAVPVRNPTEARAAAAAAAKFANLGEALRGLLLVVRCGEEETVRVPVGDFFCGAPDWKPHKAGARLGITPDEVGYCNFPMPMPDGGRISIETEEGAAAVPFGLEVFADVKGASADALRFRAAWHQRKRVPTRPFHDHLVLDVAGGPGRFVGCSLLVKNPVRGWWGEGDEKFTVDGEAFPSTFGTGTEDYFGYAWCSPQLFSSAFHAQPQCDGPGNYGFTAVNRMHALDAVPFAKSFVFDLEVWHWVEKIEMDYATVAYWYGAAGTTLRMPPVPKAAERTLDRLPPVQVFVAKDALEGETLRVVSCGGGKHVVQDTGFAENTFSRDAQRWWMDGKEGDELVLAVPVPAAGRWRVTAAFCKANDYGIVQCALGGALLGEPIDLFAEKVATTGPLALGAVDLPAGDAELRLRLVGKNGKAAPRHMVGLDYVKLEPVR